MGSLPHKKIASLILAVRERYGILSFVETGTYKGDTTDWAASRFASVDTVEIDDERLEAARRRLVAHSNIRFWHGSSGGRMAEVVARQSGRAIYWLDAHKGGGYFGQGDDCPLMDELSAIGDRQDGAFIFIDDARGFLAPPPPPFDWRKWPSISEVLRTLNRAPGRYCFVLEDVIASVPSDAEGFVRSEIFKVRPKL
jgi:hypothetical protein